MGIYIRLVDINDAFKKEQVFLNSLTTKERLYHFKATKFAEIPGSPIAYWVSNQLLNDFQNPSLESFASPKQGLITGDNDRFLRLWHECNKYDFSIFSSNSRWFPINKGGEYRRWYGNQDYVINWFNDGYEIKHFFDRNGKLRSRPQNLDFNFKRGISWSLITSGAFAVREYDASFMFNVAGITCFPTDHFDYLLGLLNSKISNHIIKIINPTLNTNVGDVAKIPIILSDQYDVDHLSQECVKLEKQEWDSFEISWNFSKHPLI